MTSDPKVLPFPVPLPAEDEPVLGADLGILTGDILDAARLGLLDAAMQQQTPKAKPPKLRPVAAPKSQTLDEGPPTKGVPRIVKSRKDHAGVP